MNESSKTYWTDDPEMVERYVLGQLSPEDMRRLDEEIVDCEPCKAQLLREMQIAAGIRQHGRSALKTRLQRKIRKESSSLSRKYQIIALAAAVVIIALAVGAYQMWFTAIEPQKKFGSTEIVLQQPKQEEDRRTEEEQPERTENPAVTETPSGSEAADESGPSEEIADADMTHAAGAGAEQQSASKSIAAKKSTPAPHRKPTSKSDNRTVEKDIVATKTAPSAAELQSAPILRMGKSIWLLGSIEMIPDRVSESVARSESRLSKESAGRRMESSATRRSKTVTVQRRGGTEDVVLQQRTFGELPRSRQTQMGKNNRIETYIEQKKEGLIVTIFTDALSSDEIQRAVVESPSDDSLIIVTASQKIIYRLPSDALFRQPARR